ncbi:DUF378 domain-containing protein [Candidatus Roizmanbacteria bacterium]|nr:DUF378 domain-containing protein [Candidatus Roizmanbacteria bacterium]
MRGLNVIDLITLILVIIGALNWGLIGLFSFNLVSALFGEGTLLTRIIYIIVGAASVYLVVLVPSLSRGRQLT